MGDIRRILNEPGLLHDHSHDRQGLDTAAVQPTPSQSRWSLAGWAAVGVFAIATVVLGTSYYRATRPAELKPLVRLKVDLENEQPIGSLFGTPVIISPDGARIAYVSRNRLSVRQLSDSKNTVIAEADAIYAPFFSPDGKWIAYFTNTKLMKVPVEGGVSVTLCTLESGTRGGTWTKDGTIIATITGRSGLVRVPENGGVAVPMTELDSRTGENSHRYPSALPDGQGIIFTSQAEGGPGAMSIAVVSQDGRRRKTLVQGAMFGRYLPTSGKAGHLIYVIGSTLFAVPFDPASWELKGTPVPILEQVRSNIQNGFALFDVSQHGTMIYSEGDTSGNGILRWIEGMGKSSPLLSKSGNYQYPMFSPDGKRLAMSADGVIWIYDLSRDTLTRLTFDNGRNVGPVWSPDGRFIVFRSPQGVTWTRADGAGGPQVLIQSNEQWQPRSFSPDGKRLALYLTRPEMGSDLWIVPIEGDSTSLRAGKGDAFLQTKSNERHGTFSPDGKWIAYSSDESGRYELYVRSYPDRGGKWQISNSSGLHPAWSKTSRELFFRTDDNQLMVAEYTINGDSFVPGKTRTWSEQRLAYSGLVGNFDLAPDGKRIAAIVPASAGENDRSANQVVSSELL